MAKVAETAIIVVVEKRIFSSLVGNVYKLTDIQNLASINFIIESYGGGLFLNYFSSVHNLLKSSSTPPVIVNRRTKGFLPR